MKCVVCSSQDIEEKIVDEEIKLENDIIMVNIQTPVCGSCGERYYDRKTLKMLEDVEEKLRRKAVRLDVVGSVLRLADDEVSATTA